MIQINQKQKIKLLILSGLLREQTTMLKLLKQRIKYRVNGLAITSALTVLKIKYLILIVYLKKKTDYGTKITEIEMNFTDHSHDKYTTFPKFNTLAADLFNVRLKQADLVTKTEASIKKIIQIKQNICFLRMS